MPPARSSSSLTACRSTAWSRSATGSLSGRSRSRYSYLPGYSPELNPDEGVNDDLKQAVTRQKPARSKGQLKHAFVRHMRQ
ncbi:hypothetical protein E2C06_34730 [Dankookia rubra]|uniref:Tc1-like transposase DDE domain-containing protein n=1 Tax=Dankookia rubra TaxID=1442381 RepID=A0A4R5Q544_9PROT|nr:hypothetical protein E2C06_34730 [Dankookia rubra]